MTFSEYRVTSEYGWRKHPITGKLKFHAGIDLVKGHRSPIYAFASGTVMYAGEGKKGTGLGGYGNVVFIRDSDGRGHLYAHLDSVEVKKGQTVTKGDRIGTQGATGNVTGSHLHYEIRKKTTPSYGWTSNPEKSTLSPTKYLEGLNMQKKANLKVDGILGPKTIKALQEYLGTPADGKISKPSTMVKELQRRLNQGYL